MLKIMQTAQENCSNTLLTILYRRNINRTKKVIYYEKKEQIKDI